MSPSGTAGLLNPLSRTTEYRTSNTPSKASSIVAGEYCPFDLRTCTLCPGRYKYPSYGSGASDAVDGPKSSWAGDVIASDGGSGSSTCIVIPAASPSGTATSKRPPHVASTCSRSPATKPSGTTTCSFSNPGAGSSAASCSTVITSPGNKPLGTSTVIVSWPMSTLISSPAATPSGTTTSSRAMRLSLFVDGDRAVRRGCAGGGGRRGRAAQRALPR
mmetsp:Transcript_32400/g.55440  ORF Transcript_32400/g.55440 Transcript_32400/m.55440 type:complete len:217 (+) Transcript_32400:322-972(+)